MPHATLPSPGFQALILCGPGVSLNTFTSNPSEFPKALVPIANRPMVWYPLEWCYRMGISNISLITPPESEKALDSALAQNPYLTSLPAPTPRIIAPNGLDQNTGTAELLRLPEVQDAITSDFIVLPCDIVCELDGLALLEDWMVQEAGFGGASGGFADDGQTAPLGLGGERLGRRGGLGVWYSVKQGENTINGEQTDFIATTPIDPPLVPPSKSSLRKNVERVVMSMPTDSLNDILEEQKAFSIRHRLFQHFSKVKIRNSMRDAHIYLFPYWVKHLIAKNEKLDSVGEDVVGWWAKAGWQDGLGEKLGLREILQPQASRSRGLDGLANSTSQLEQNIDVASYSTTRIAPQEDQQQTQSVFASRVRDMGCPPASLELTRRLIIPPILGYIQPSTDAIVSLIRRVDTPELLRHVSLVLAKQASLTDGSTSPFAHQAKITHPDNIPKQCRVEAENSLLDANVIVAEKVNIKQCVIGVNCSIGAGSRLQGCVLMEACTVGENVQLTDCILGPRCRIEGGSRKDENKTVLWACEVEGNYVVSWGTEAKAEKFMVFETLSDDGAANESLEATDGLVDEGVSTR